MIKKITYLLLTPLMMITGGINLEAYTKKAPYEGYGQPSKVNGQPKLKLNNGYFKKDGTYVNPYARSR